MMYRTTNLSGSYVSPEARLLTIRILWALCLTTIGVYTLAAVTFLPQSDGLKTRLDDPSLLSALTATAIVSVSLSFVLKRRFYAGAVERGEPARVQQGFIVAAALSLLSAVLGFAGLCFTLNREAYLLIALGALGVALHFPRRDELAAAYRKGW